MSAESTPELREGDWLDVVDGDGIWNVAQVLRLPTADSVEVTYDCWGDEYNEELPRSSPRIAPFHTHTYAVKCWAKLDTWPWWPALVTVRAPGSDRGSTNLRLEERLLVDFLDKGEFMERCRCWVKKSKVVSFQSDEKARKCLLVMGRKRKTKGHARLRDLGFSTSLLARCDAREDFPEFAEGTLPVKFKSNCTPPTEEVRKEMGEQIWLRGFAENRANHAATHGYTSVVGAGEDPEKENSKQTPTSAAENTTSKAATTDTKQTRAKDATTTGTENNVGGKTTGGVSKQTKPTENNQSTAHGANTRKRLRKTQIPAQAKNAATTEAEVGDKTSVPKQKKPTENNQSTAQGVNIRKRSRQNQNQAQVKNPAMTEAEVGHTTSVPEQTKSTENNQSKAQGGKTRKRSRHVDDNENSDGTDTSQTSAFKPPCEQSQCDGEDKEQGAKLVADERLEAKSAASAPNNANATQELRVASRKYGKTPKMLKTSSRAAGNLPLYTPSHARVLLGVKSTKEQQTTRVSPTDNVRCNTEARPHTKTGTANEKLPAAGLQVRRPLIALKKVSIDANFDDGPVSPMETLARMTKVTVKAGRKLQTLEGALGDKLNELAKKSTKAEKLRSKCAAFPAEDSSRKPAPSTGKSEDQENTNNNRSDVSRVPLLTRRSSHGKCGIRELELALDVTISKNQGSAITTREEFDAVKADLLNSQEVQAAISRIQNPSYGWTACTAKAFTAASSLSSDDSRRTFEKVKSGYAKYRKQTASSDPKGSLRSPSQQFSRAWGYESERGSSGERSLESAPADHSNFGFSVNDNFSTSQWHRDLYPKAFN